MEYANRSGWSDITPHQVIQIKNDKLMVIREMHCDVVRVPDASPGGFCAHFENSQQEWHIEPDETNPLVKIRLHKDRKWRDRHGNVYSLHDRPIKFYDYNF